MNANAVAAQPVAAQPESTDFWSDLSEQFNYVFFNQAPSANPTNDPSDSEDGEITGRLGAESNNSFGLTYQIVDKEKYGTLNFDYVTGSYTYTPDAVLAQPGITDYFTVTINNGTYAAAARIPRGDPAATSPVGHQCGAVAA